MNTKDKLIVTISDTHSGGSTALFPDYPIQFEERICSPTDKQKQIYEHWKYCAAEIRKARSRKDLIVVHDGDAIEGWHHNTTQVMTMVKKEQITIHIGLMDTFLKAVNFGEGDKLYYTKGTAVHGEDAESIIAEDLSAEKAHEQAYAFDELRLNINGRDVWWVHHGPRAGEGHNRGNALRNWLKAVFYGSHQEGIKPPDFIITGHVHDPDWNDYIGRMDGRYHKIHGLICPSWQQKTRYAYAKAPTKRNKIGLQYFVITKDGLIGDPVELLMR